VAFVSSHDWEIVMASRSRGLGFVSAVHPFSPDKGTHQTEEGPEESDDTTSREPMALLKKMQAGWRRDGHWTGPVSPKPGVPSIA